MNNENIIPKIKSKRYNSDTGEYNKKPNGPEYFKTYWQEHNEKVPCTRCGCMVVKLRMCKHKVSKMPNGSKNRNVLPDSGGLIGKQSFRTSR